MTLGTVLGLVCLVLAVVTAAVGTWLFSPLGWLVAAIAVVMVLGGVGFGPFVVGRRE
jgi:hypothetical protein